MLNEFVHADSRHTFPCMGWSYLQPEWTRVLLGGHGRFGGLVDRPTEISLCVDMRPCHRFIVLEDDNQLNLAIYSFIVYVVQY